ncbi:DUF2321 domain-containing protein [Natrinema versiforme]|uniref:DUF2321 domain-containing protein n=1 Tax=Natrinema versiforme TaxID=88724 RepID=A0A4P8WHL0_9EURY|nr:DUF2321 domain-containing protein [Natrinema versiforme]QCS42635.1 DUF2321 domain-containing protein [Natrinema versiforme]
MTTYGQVCETGHILNHSTNTEWLAGDNNYCPTCGGEGLTECPNCQNNKIIVSDDVLSSDAELTRADLPLYCGNCGTTFPWAGNDEDPQRINQQFVATDLVEERYYQNIVDEINRVYQVGADSATLVLVRKAIENSIIDILRNEYTLSESHLFFDGNIGQHRGLSELVDNLDDRLDDFDQYNVGTNQTLITRINELKENGDIEAHSVASNHSQVEMDEYSEKANFVLNILFELRRRTWEENNSN